MKNEEIADIFARMADLLELLGEDSFRASSYRRASRAMADLIEPVEAVAAEKRLRDIAGIGELTAAKIDEYLRTGHVARYDELLAKVPPRLPELLTVPNLGPKTVAKLWRQADIKSLAELQAVLDTDPDRLINLPGMGERKVQVLRQCLSQGSGESGRVLLGAAWEVAEGLVAAIKAIPGVARVEPAGSLRRGRETIGDIDIVCQAPAQSSQAVVDAFVSGLAGRRVLAQGPTKGSVQLAGSLQADLRVVPPESFGSAMAYFTGSKAHNICLRGLALDRGWKLNEYGLFDGERRIAGPDEEGIYKALGLQFTPPELREDRGEIEAAAEGKLPELLELSDIRGDLHMHTIASDGVSTLDEMIGACRDRGYQYLCISEHSKRQHQARGLDEARLAEHIRLVRKTAAKHPDMLVLMGTEVDILKDGTLDYAADVLAQLDFVIASPHTALLQRSDEATPRLIKVIESGQVHCIGHPTGRLVLGRPGMEIDIDKIARAAAANGVALEINANPHRLDLRDVHVRAAVNAGAKLIINTDSHSTPELDLMRYGVMTARRGWAKTSDVLNTLTAAQLKKWLKRQAV